MEICTHCRAPIRPSLVQWLEKFVAKQTHRSPEEYDRVPFCQACYDLVTDPDYQAYCDEQESLRGLSDDERERI